MDVYKNVILCVMGIISFVRCVKVMLFVILVIYWCLDFVKVVVLFGMIILKDVKVLVVFVSRKIFKCNFVNFYNVEI